MNDLGPAILIAGPVMLVLTILASEWRRRRSRRGYFSPENLN